MGSEASRVRNLGSWAFMAGMVSHLVYESEHVGKVGEWMSTRGYTETKGQEWQEYTYPSAFQPSIHSCRVHVPMRFDLSS